jgi:hypothetical protein
MRQSDAIAMAPPAYSWMADLLYARPPAVTWAPAGSLPAGYERVDELALLPTGAGRSFMVSLTSRRGSASALTCYNALRPWRKRVARGALGLGLRTGVAQLLLRTKIDVGVRSDPGAAGATGQLLMEHLGHFFGEGPVAVAISGGDGPYRKPVLHVFSATGTPLGYVKVGWNDWTRNGVRREASALQACATAPVRLGAPKLLGLSSWQGLDLLVTAPLPQRARGFGTTSPLPDTAVLREIGQLSSTSSGPLAASQWWRDVRSRIHATATEPAARAALELAAGRIERDHGRAALDYSFCHGDLVPWNLAKAGGRLYAWDWESCAPDAPLGFDAVHFHFQVAFVGRGLPLSEAAALAASAARPALRELGVAAGHCGLVANLHLLELLLRHEEARSAAGDADDRFYPAIVDVLDRRLAMPGMAGLWPSGSVA